MSNLLPKKNKKRIRTEYLLRLLITFMILSALTLVFSFIFLIPSYLLSGERAKVATGEVNSLKNQLEQRQKEETSLALFSTNEEIEVLNLSLSPNLTKAISLIISEIGVSIGIHSFTFAESSKGEKTIFIGGEARNRDSLIEFTKALENLNQFARVELPVSNLAKNKDINFNISLILLKSSL